MYTFGLRDYFASVITRKFSHFLYLQGAQEKFGDTKAVIRSCKSKKDRHYNGQKKKD
jgi:hypothetical protein